MLGRARLDGARADRVRRVARPSWSPGATGWGLPASPVLPLAINEIAPGVEVRGPFAELEDELLELHRHQAERYSGSLPESPPSR